MPVWKEDIFGEGIYFITFTNYKWIPLFKITNGSDFVYKWFDHLIAKGHCVLGYVIMPNHVHALIGFVDNGKSVNTIVGNGKRFMAYDIVEKLKERNETEILKTLEDGVLPADRKKGQLHVVFEPSFDAKLCRTYKFVFQKLDYIHVNPVSKKWDFAPHAAAYLHSSAAYYETGKQTIYKITNVADWINDHWYTRPEQGSSAPVP